MKHLLKKILNNRSKNIALLLCLSFLMIATSAFSFAADFVNLENTNPQPVLRSVILDEVVERRDVAEKHFISDEGSYVAIAYPHAVHMESDEGQWVDADYPLAQEGNWIVPPDENIFLAADTVSAQSDGLVRIDTEQYVVSWTIDNLVESVQAQVKSSAESSTGKNQVTSEERQAAIESVLELKRATQENLEVSDWSSDMQSQVDNVNAQINEVNRLSIFNITELSSVVEYPEALGDGTTLRYWVSPGQLKEEIELDYRGDFISYSMVMDTAGLNAVLQENNSVLLLDETGETIIVIGSPNMYDAVTEVSFDFDITVEQNDNQCIITFTPNMAWLNAPERVWPVVIDPWISSGTNAANHSDNFVYSNQSTAHSHTDTWLAAGWGASPAGSAVVEHRAYWKALVLPGLSSGLVTASNLQEVRFSIYVVSGSQYAPTLQLYKVPSTWSSSTITFSNQPSVPSSSISSGSPGFNNAWLDYASYNNSALFNTVKGWYQSSSTNHGFMLKHASNAGARNTFYSSDHTTTSLRPYLEVEY
ncbi:MAG: DNRLRE domain-containing protein [Oscillospiraceae bacterium]|jgi:hypothetical protein|nr:DNRLRE domain-containing protein [Oscillospiraceae bacterium]